ncbi:MAG: PAS domain S-box protein [Pseudohongiellaceae bacterium]
MMSQSTTSSKQRKTPRLLIFIQFFAPALLLSIIALGGFFYLEYEERLAEIAADDRVLVNSLGQSLLNEIAIVQADVSTFTQAYLLYDYMAGEEAFLGPINNRFTDLVAIRTIYEDIRLIDSSGAEITRIHYNRNDDSVTVLPPAQLQNVGGEFYFQRGMQLSAGELFLSDLRPSNVDGGLAEPVMHFAAPLFDLSGNRFGVLSFSYAATEYLQRFKTFGQRPNQETWLLNQAGYWISSSEPEDEWAFMYPDRLDRNLANRHPEVWLNLRVPSRNTFTIDGDLYSYVRVCGEANCEFESQLNAAQSIQLPTLLAESEWIAVSRIPRSELGMIDLLRPYPERWMLISLVILAVMLLTAYAAHSFAGIVTALRRKEAQLVQSRSLHEGFFEKNPSIMFVKDLQGNYSLVNESFYKFTRTKREEFEDISQTKFFPEETNKLMRDQDLQIIEYKQAMEFEGKWNGTAGDEYFSILRFPLLNDIGEVYAVGGIATDRSDQIKARKALRESEAQFRSLVESAPEAVIITNILGNILLVNKQAEILFKYNRGQLIHKRLKELLPSIELDRIVKSRANDSETSQVHELASMNASVAEGLSVPVDVAISTTETESGLTITFLIRDVSDRSKLEAQLRQSQKMDAIGKLTGGMAHDFNNLLGVIMGNIDLAQRKIDKNSPEYHRMDTAKKAAGRGAELTKRMLAVARRQPLQPKATNINDIVKEMTDILPRTLGPDIEMKYDINENVPDVLVDQSGLENAFLNLAINSRDAMPNGGKFYITTDVLHLSEENPLALQDDMHPGAYVQISVTDTGEGMSQETLSRVFEPFFTTKERGKGTGLGLSMIYGFVKQSEGNVRMYSEPGVGTTLDMFLPAAKEKSEKRVTETVDPTKLATRFDSIKVLAVDDEYDLLEVASAYLEDMGFEVIAATNGEQAMTSIEHNPDIRLLVTDIVMPGGMSGTELSQKARQKLPNIKVLYMSGFPSGVIADKSGAALDAPLLTKPYSLNELSSALVELLKDTV